MKTDCKLFVWIGIVVYPVTRIIKQSTKLNRDLNRITTDILLGLYKRSFPFQNFFYLDMLFKQHCHFRFLLTRMEELTNLRIFLRYIR